MSDETIDIEKALRLAFNLGETHWQQADSESYSQNRKSEATRAKFNALVADAVAALAQPQAPSVPAGIEAMREVIQRMASGIDHLDKLAREWEPDHSSGADRRGWLLAKDARDDAARMLAAAPPVAQEAAGAVAPAEPEFCCEHSWTAAKALAWKAVQAQPYCGCDHNESCLKCWPADFRKGGKWSDYKAAAAPVGLDAKAATELQALREKVGMAYGYLWCANNEPSTPDQYPPVRAAYEARKLLRDTMTHDERGRYINLVLPLVRGPDAAAPQAQAAPPATEVQP